MLILAIVIAFAISFLVYALAKIFGPGGSMQQDKLLQKRIEQPGDAASSTTDGNLTKRFYLSDIPFISDFLSSFKVANRISTTLKMGRIKMSVSTYFLICGVMGVLAFFVAQKFLTVMNSAIISLIFIALPFVILSVLRRRYVAKFSEYFPNALSIMASSLKVGHVLERSIDSVVRTSPSPLSDEFRIVQGELQLGVPLSTALHNLYARIGGQELKIMITGIAINQELGGNLSEILANIEKTIRERYALLREINTLSAQGRVTGIILACIPAVLGYFSYNNNKANFVQFFQSGNGQIAIAIIIGLYIVAFFWIKKIISLKD